MIYVNVTADDLYDAAAAIAEGFEVDWEDENGRLVRLMPVTSPYIVEVQF